MTRTYHLGKLGAQLWLRERGKAARAEVEAVLDETAPGDTVVIDMTGVEVFDFSFAGEFFGRLIQRLPTEYPGRFLLISNIGEWARLNLGASLDGLDLAAIVREDQGFVLAGKVAETDRVTFAALVTAGGQATAPQLADELGIGLTAMNERLTKLVRAGLVQRQDAPGRTRFTYTSPS